MNALKKKILSMQEKERIKAIIKLKSMSKTKHSQKTLKSDIKKRKVDTMGENEIEDIIENETEAYREDAHDDD